MINSTCKKVISLLSLYIENKLSVEDKFFVESHLKECSACNEKYLEMKDILKNLHFEYKKLVDEFQKIENDKIFSIREYENFHNNISPYIDDELCYDESINFRKYLLKSKPARTELSLAYGLKNNIKMSVADFKNSLNINFSNRIMKQIKNKKPESFETIYTRTMYVLLFLISSLMLICFSVGFSYIQSAVNTKEKFSTIETVNTESENEFVEQNANSKPDLFSNLKQ